MIVIGVILDILGGLAYGLALWESRKIKLMLRQPRPVRVSPEPEQPAMTAEHAQILAALVDVRPQVAPAAKANGSILADELRRLEAGSDHEIAVLLLELAVFAGGLERREAEPADRWRVMTDAMAMAAVDLTELDRQTA